MSYISERRLEEKERRRAEILDAAEAVAIVVGWEEMTMDELARKARLSRALLYVYFKDKTDLMFGVAERALTILRQRFEQAAAAHARGRDQVHAIGRAYVEFAREYPLYFSIMSRCELRTPDGVEPESNEGRCQGRGDSLQTILVASIETGMRDGSLRSDAGHPAVIAVVLWGFMHGVIQLAASKVNLLKHKGVEVEQLMEQALLMASRSIEAHE